jgi:hypothetical protein
LGKGKLVTSSGISDATGAVSITGFSIVRAETIDAALGIAQQCPYLDHGTIEVAEVMEMK